MNGGQCVEGHTQVACVCQWGFTGKLCEVSLHNDSTCHVLATALFWSK